MKDIGVFIDNGKVDVKLIRAFEKEKDVSFPDAYVELIRNHDYLMPIKCDFDFIYDNEKDSRDISFLGYDKSVYSMSNIYGEEIYSSLYPDNKIIEFGICANGDSICFFYENPKEEPKIVLIFHDLFYDNAVSEHDRVIVFIADNFESFIDMLYRYNDEGS